MKFLESKPWKKGQYTKITPDKPLKCCFRFPRVVDYDHCSSGTWCLFWSTCLCVFPWACHDEVEKGLISPRKCFSSLSHAEVWRIKVHWFPQPPGHRLKCELWPRPLLEVFLLTAPNSATPPLIHPLLPPYPRALSKGIICLLIHPVIVVVWFQKHLKGISADQVQM